MCIFRLRKGQTIYFYRQTGAFRGSIQSGTITGITKDLVTGKVTYSISPNFPLDTYAVLFNSSTVLTLTRDQIYTNKKKIEKEYKDEILYQHFEEKINDLYKLLNDICVQTAPKREDLGVYTLGNAASLNTTARILSHDIEVDGVGSVQEAITKLQKDVESLKKKASKQKKTKKPVIDSKASEKSDEGGKQ